MIVQVAGTILESDSALAILIEKYAETWPFNVADASAWRGDIGRSLEHCREPGRACLGRIAVMQPEATRTGLDNDVPSDTRRG